MAAIIEDLFDASLLEGLDLYALPRLCSETGELNCCRMLHVLNEAADR